MKNLVLLNERRHSASFTSSSVSSSSSPTINNNDYAIAIVPNPNADHDMIDNYGCEEDPTPHNFVLTPAGNLYALSSTDTILWSLDLSSIELGDSEELEQTKEDIDTTTTRIASWFHLSYNESSEVLVALSHSGAIISIDPLAVNAELIGAFDHGIQCAAWSEDKEVLALVTFQFEEEDDNETLLADPKLQEESKVLDDGSPSNDLDGHLDGHLDVAPSPLPVLMTMNTAYEILSEVSLPAHTQGESISLCWNKKTDEPLVAISTHDISDSTRKIRIYNGQTLDISSVGRSEDGSGKVLPNLLNPQSGTAMSWAGAATSNLLTCIQRKGKKSKNVVFIESNGLQHGGFKLDHVNQHEEVVGVTFNAENDVLAMTLVSKNLGDIDDSFTPAQTSKVQLYHRCNYHWYLKYEISYPNSICVTNTRFDDVKGYDLSVSIRSQTLSDTDSYSNNHRGKLEWRHYTFVWDCSTTSPTGTATVIDGTTLNMTHFDKAIIPPPMCAETLTFNSPIIGIAHEQSISASTSSLSNCNISLIVQLSNGSLSFCGHVTGNDSIKVATNTTKNGSMAQLCSLNLNLYDTESVISDHSRLRQFLILDQVHNGDSIFVALVAIACSSSSKVSSESLVYIVIEINNVGGDVQSSKVVYFNEMKLNSTVLRMARWSDSTGGALVEFIDGSLVNFSSSLSKRLNKDDDDREGENISPCNEGMLEPCPWIAGMLNADTGIPLVVGLSSRYRLYSGERLLCSASSSFIISPTHEFLSYVTIGSRAQLRFLPLSLLTDFDPLMGSDDNLDILTQGYEPRDVERGSRMVAVLPQKPSAIIQLPRGNLELLNPRALVLPHIMTLIDHGEYRLAIDLMRRQKVDMNLIVDMDPQQFIMKGVETLVQQVTNIDHLNLFIASLNNSDVKEWKYPIPRWFRRERISEDTTSVDEISFDFTSKVNQVCSKLRSVMLSTSPSNDTKDEYYLLPILSTFAKEDPPKLDEALSLISQMQKVVLLLLAPGIHSKR